MHAPLQSICGRTHNDDQYKRNANLLLAWCDVALKTAVAEVKVANLRLHAGYQPPPHLTWPHSKAPPTHRPTNRCIGWQIVECSFECVAVLFMQPLGKDLFPGLPRDHVVATPRLSNCSKELL